MSDDDTQPATTDPRDPRVLVSTGDIDPAVGTHGVAGAVWRHTDEDRGLDANVVQLPPGGSIDPHEGPALDVLWHVVAGGGALLTSGGGSTALSPGDVVHLPRGS
ncbi:MAG: cupin domain-containing protein, partial [Actinomycetaceae bacterium]